jgi:peptidoglycan/LPS O-acetylase OafA/YrhL
MAVTALAFFTTLLLAEASWRWFEKPFVDWSHRLFRYRQPEASQPVHPSH